VEAYSLCAHTVYMCKRTTRNNIVVNSMLGLSLNAGHIFHTLIQGCSGLETRSHTFLH